VRVILHASAQKSEHVCNRAAVISKLKLILAERTLVSVNFQSGQSALLHAVEVPGLEREVTCAAERLTLKLRHVILIQEVMARQANGLHVRLLVLAEFSSGNPSTPAVFRSNQSRRLAESLVFTPIGLPGLRVHQLALESELGIKSIAVERKITLKKKCVDQEVIMKVGEVGVHVLNLAPEDRDHVKGVTLATCQ